MRKVLLALAGLVPLALWAATGYSPTLGAAGAGSYTITVVDADISSSWKFVVADTGFTQMSADTTITVIHDTTGPAGTTADTALVTITGLDTLYKWQKETVKVAGDDTVATSKKWYAYERAWLDTAVAGRILVKPAGGTKLDSIVGGTLTRGIGHVFYPQYAEPRVWSLQADLVSVTDTVDIEVRGYPLATAARDQTTGYAVLLRTRLTKTETRLDEPIDAVLPNGGIISVWSKATTATGNATVQYRLKGSYSGGGRR